MLPSAEVPSTVAEFVAQLGPESKTLKDYAQELMVRGSDSTLKLLLSRGMDVDYESILYDFHKKSDGRPSSLKKYSTCVSRLAKSSIATMERRSAAVAAV